MQRERALFVTAQILASKGEAADRETRALVIDRLRPGLAEIECDLAGRDQGRRHDAMRVLVR